MRLSKTFLLLFLVTGFPAGRPDQLVAGPSQIEYLPGRIIVKLHENVAEYHTLILAGQQTADAEARELLNSLLQAYEPGILHPVLGPAALSSPGLLHKDRPGAGTGLNDAAGELRRTWTVTYRSGDDPAMVAAEIDGHPDVAYAEPHYVHRTAEAIDDPEGSLMAEDGSVTLPSATGAVNPVTSRDSPAGSPDAMTGNSPPSGYIPDDPFIGQDTHNYFDYLNFFRAWDVNRGSPEVVIAIVDSGVWYDHPDLRDNLWHNPEPGKADEYFPEFHITGDTIGWNFWESGDIYAGEEPVQNADPSGRHSTHGTMVAGIASAVTDNGYGIAGTGFRSRFMPVKVGGTQEYPGVIAYGYHGILYAAVNGADVINCSFIGAGRSNFGTDVIRFAGERGSVVVAAAGNDGISTSGVFPASYDEVLGVGAVSSSFDDQLTRFSNYGRAADVYAVGQNMISTNFEYEAGENGDGNGAVEERWTANFRVSGGTSLAAPVVSGLAALIKAEHPDWPAPRITSQIRGTARDIREANPAPEYRNLLGHGVIDAYAAMTQLIPAISFTDHEFLNEKNRKISAGESGTLTIHGVHYGSPSPEIAFTLESVSPGITIHTTGKSLTGLEPGETFSVGFPLSIDPDYQLDRVPEFHMKWSSGDTADPSYTGRHTVFYESLLYGNMDANRLTMSVPSDGTLGFMFPEDRTVGQGLIPAGHENVLAEAGFMIRGYRNGEPVLINQVRDSTGISRHFRPVKNFRFRDHPNLRNVQYGTAEFHSDRHPGAGELRVELEALSVNTRDVDRTLLLIYHIINDSDQRYSDLYFGLFNHWEFRKSGLHHTRYLPDDHLMTVVHESGPPYVGISVLGDVSGALAIDADSEMTLDRAGSRSDSLAFGIQYNDDDRLDGFTDAEKWLALTAGTDYAERSAGNIATVTATGPYTLYPRSSVTVGFIYGWETTNDRLSNQIAAAGSGDYVRTDPPGDYARTGRVADELTLYPNYPNPFNNRTQIRFDLAESGFVELIIYDILGRRVAVLVNETLEEGPHFVDFNASGLAGGFYLTVLKTAGVTKSDTMMLVR